MAEAADSNLLNRLNTLHAEASRKRERRREASMSPRSPAPRVAAFIPHDAPMRTSVAAWISPEIRRKSALDGFDGLAQTHRKAVPSPRYPQNEPLLVVDLPSTLGEQELRDAAIEQPPTSGVETTPRASKELPETGTTPCSVFADERTMLGSAMRAPCEAFDAKTRSKRGVSFASEVAARIVAASQCPPQPVPPQPVLPPPHLVPPPGHIGRRTIDHDWIAEMRQQQRESAGLLSPRVLRWCQTETLEAERVGGPLHDDLLAGVPHALNRPSSSEALEALLELMDGVSVRPGPPPLSIPEVPETPRLCEAC